MMAKLTAEDGHKFECWMVAAQGLRKSTLVILQEISGVTEQLKALPKIMRHWAFKLLFRRCLTDRKRQPLSHSRRAPRA